MRNRDTERRRQRQRETERDGERQRETERDRERQRRTDGVGHSERHVAVDHDGKVRPDGSTPLHTERDRESERARERERERRGGGERGETGDLLVGFNVLLLATHPTMCQ